MAPEKIYSALLNGPDLILSAGETIPTGVYITMATAADLESLFQHAKAASPESVDKEPYDTVSPHFPALKPQAACRNQTPVIWPQDYGSRDMALKHQGVSFYFGTYAPAGPPEAPN